MQSGGGAEKVVVGRWCREGGGVAQRRREKEEYMQGRREKELPQVGLKKLEKIAKPKTSTERRKEAAMQRKIDNGAKGHGSSGGAGNRKNLHRKKGRAGFFMDVGA